MKNLLSVLTIPLLLAACANGPTTGSMPIPKHPEQAADVTIIRKSVFVGAAISYWLTYDGEEFFSIRNGQNFSFKADPGPHRLGVKMFGGLTPTVKENEIQTTFAPMQKYYFVVAPTFSSAAISPASEAEGLGLVAKTRTMAAPAASQR